MFSAANCQSKQIDLAVLLQLAVGDRLFLGKAEQAIGFRVQVTSNGGYACQTVGMHGRMLLNCRLSVHMQMSKQSSGSAAEQAAKRKKLLPGGSGPSSLPSSKRQALSGASSGGCHPPEAPIAAAAGPLSGLHLVFWRLKHSKQLRDQVPNTCKRLLDVEPDSYFQLHTDADLSL